jgi:hypothetical protein
MINDADDAKIPDARLWKLRILGRLLLRRHFVSHPT